jgi:hypothetical protein
MWFRVGTNLVTWLVGCLVNSFVSSLLSVNLRCCILEIWLWICRNYFLTAFGAFPTKSSKNWFIRFVMFASPAADWNNSRAEEWIFIKRFICEFCQNVSTYCKLGYNRINVTDTALSLTLAERSGLRQATLRFRNSTHSHHWPIFQVVQQIVLCLPFTVSQVCCHFLSPFK